MSLPEGWTQKSWGLIDQHANARAPLYGLAPCTSRCREVCALCKDKPCSKANGHTLRCNCHHLSCAPQYDRNTGAVTYGRAVSK